MEILTKSYGRETEQSQSTHSKTRVKNQKKFNISDSSENYTEIKRANSMTFGEETMSIIVHMSEICQLEEREKNLVSRQNSPQTLSAPTKRSESRQN